MSDKNKTKLLRPYDPLYDSDEDLSPEDQKDIKDREDHIGPESAQKARDDAWDKAPFFPKIMKLVKTGFDGDKRAKKN